MKAMFRRYLMENDEFLEGTHWQRRHYRAGSEIIRQGDVSDGVYMVEKGTVRVIGRIVLEEGRLASPNVCDLGEGEVFGELSLFDHHPRSASVVAVTDCQVVHMEGKALRAFMESHPHIGLNLVWALAESLVGRLRETNKKIFALYAWGLKAHQVDM